MPTLGFIGLGNMGGPMAHNLAAAGHEVVCFDAAGTAALAPPAAPTAESVAEVAQRARIVFLCSCPTGPWSCEWLARWPTVPTARSKSWWTAPPPACRTRARPTTYWRKPASATLMRR